MAEHDNDFIQETSGENLEQSLDQFIAENAQLAHALRARYSAIREQQAQTLARAWERIQQGRQPTAAQNRREARIVLWEHQREPDEKRLHMEKSKIDPQKKSWPTRAFATLAAVLLTGVIAGSLLLVYSAAHRSPQAGTSQQHTQAITVSTPTSRPTANIPDVPGIYTLDTNKKVVQKYDDHTRALLWSAPIEMDGLTGNPLIVKGDTVYVATAGANDNFVYAIDAHSGALRWKLAMDQYTAPGTSENDAYYSGMLEPPVDANGVLYIMSQSGRLVALNAISGKYLWTYNAGTTGFVDGTTYSCAQPAFITGVVYGACHNVVFAVAAESGKALWSKSIAADQIFNDPQAADGNVYLTSYVESQHHGGTWMNGAVYAFNGTSGASLWSHQVNNWVLDSPTVVNGVVYFGSHNNNVYALRANDGSQLWRYEAGGLVRDTPVVSDGVVYIDQQGLFSFTGNLGIPSLIAINATSGKRLWEKQASVSPITSHNGILYAEDSNGISALNEQNGSQIWHIKVNMFGVEIVF